MSKNSKALNKILSIVLVMIMVVSTIPSFALNANATDIQGVEVNEGNFPDANFRDWVQTNASIEDGGKYYINTAVTQIDVSSRSISNLTGIEHFVNLQSLDCSDNQLTSLDNIPDTVILANISPQNYFGDDFTLVLDGTSYSFDLSQLTNIVDTTNVSFEGGIINEGVVTFDIDPRTNDKITYKYNTGKANNYLNVKIPVTIEDNRVEVNETNFPDDDFRHWVQINASIQDGGKYYVNVDITKININGLDSSNLKGIEHFINLTELNCSKNKLTSLDASKNTNLTVLNCSYNKLTSLDVSENTNLKDLNCYNNQLTSLNISGLIKLENLICSVNQLESLDVNGLTNLKDLYCASNKLNSLDVNGLTNLKDLFCSKNQLTSLDISKNLNLENLTCSENQLTSLDNAPDSITEIGTNPQNYLGNDFILGYNGTNYTFDLSQLEDLGVNTDKITFNFGTITNGVVTFSNYPVTNGKMKYMYSTGRYIALKVNIPVTIKDNRVEVNEENFPDDVFRNYVMINASVLDNGKRYVDTKKEIITLNSENIISLKGIEHFVKLKELYCNNNQLTSLDVSKNANLEYIDCSDNQLTDLDLSTLKKLIMVSCKNNDLETLAISGATELTNLDCSGNQLKSLDVSGFINLVVLNCGNNQLTNLDNIPSSVVTANISPQNYLGNSSKLIFNGAYYFFDPSQLNGIVNTKKISFANGTITNNNSFMFLADPRTDDKITYSYNTGKTGVYLDVKIPVTFENIAVEVSEKNFPDKNFRDWVIDNASVKVSGVYFVNPYITSIEVIDQRISDLTGIEHFVNLQSLDCSNNQLESLDVSKLKELRDLICVTNQLTDLNLSGLTKLEFINCSNNLLTSLAISELTKLDQLYCGENHLISLDTTKITKLRWVDCSRNSLTSLDTSKNLNLEGLICNGNNLTSLDVSKNTNLEEIICSNNQLTSLDISKNPKLIKFYCNDNNLTSLDNISSTVTDFRINPQTYSGTDLDLVFNGKKYSFDLNQLNDVVDVSKISFNDASISNGIVTFNTDPRNGNNITYNYNTSHNANGSNTVLEVSVPVKVTDKPVPTATPNPVPTATPNPVPTVTPSASPAPTAVPSASPAPTTIPSISPTPTATTSPATGDTTDLTWIYIVLAAAVIGVVVILVILKRKK